ncbi:MAG: response regulator transcription factor [Lachnospiraceae bacterium]|nr:response regulator transcription factor [Lachnospiraceae bacterium]
MLKILVLEDEKAQLDRLKKFLAQYGDENPSFEYSLTAYDRGVLLLTDYRRDADLIFLDIRVPDMLGIDVARKIRESDDKVMIIFVTSLTQYAIDGYSVNAFDYILKPLQYPSFSAKLKRALNVLSYREPSLMIDLRTKEGGRRISADSVTYVESSAHDILFHSGGEVIRQWGTLTKYEEILKDAHFVRCNTSFLVNLKYVHGVRKDEVDVDGNMLPISRSRRKEFLAALARYKGGSL